MSAPKLSEMAAEAEAREVQLRAALESCRAYFRQAVFSQQPHLNGCRAPLGGPCTCGFDAAVAAVAEGRP